MGAEQGRVVQRDVEVAALRPRVAPLLQPLGADKAPGVACRQPGSQEGRQEVNRKVSGENAAEG